MKKASMVLGIVGGSLAILSAVMLIVLLTVFLPFMYDMSGGSADIIRDGMFGIFRPLYTVMAIMCFIAGGMGIAGGIIVKKKNVLAGVLMLVAAVISGLNVVLLVGGILALVQEKKQAPDLPQIIA